LKEGDYFGRTRRRLEDNIDVDLKEISWEDIHLGHVAKDSDNLGAVVSTVVKFRVP
jgi:translation elongation factor EF-1alpha